MMFENPWSLIIVFLVVGWLIQFGLSYFQMQNYAGRLRELRQDGLLSVGKGGGQYRGRVYGVLVVDAENRIIHAEKLSGVTVFARLKPVPQLVGRRAEDLLAEDADLGVSKKLTEAFQFAASEIINADQSNDASSSDEGVPGNFSVA